MNAPTRLACAISALAGFVAVILTGVHLHAREERPVRARLPAIDLHTHLGGVETWPGKMPNFHELLSSMDARNVTVVVDFKAPSPGHEIFGERVTQRLAQYPDLGRLKLFANVPVADPGQVFLAESTPNYKEWVAGLLRESIVRGAVGLKLKFQGGGAGSWTYDSRSVLVPLDTPQFDLLWEEAAKLRVPVLIHFAETYKTDHQLGSRSDFVRWEMLMYERERVLRKHPRLMLVGAHWGSAAQDLTYLAEVLYKYPNFYVEGAAHQAKDAFGTVGSYKQQLLTTFQDKIMFGTDYMEGTFSWLRSYLQRLDMILPWVERWPVTDAVFEKFYSRNAKQLLHLNTENAVPVAHAGFTRTRLVGELMTLDGSGSYDFEGSSLTYRWRQMSGVGVTLSSLSSARPTFIPPREGTYGFELVVHDGRHTSAPRHVTVNVMTGDGLFQESNGLVVMEAEHYWRKTDQERRGWTFANTLRGFSGRGYMEIGPDTGAVAEINQLRTRAAELEYKVWITNAGTYVVFLRGYAPDADGDSVHVGLDGEEVRLADRVGNFSVGTWSWTNETRERNTETGNLDRNLAILNVVEPGPHILNVWMHKDGVKLDKIILVRHMYSQTRFPLYDPGRGEGPTESPRVHR